MNEERELTKEERKKKAIEEGIARTYIVCPLCGLNRVLEKWEKGKIKFGNFDLEKSFFVQVRYSTGGRASGFWLNENESKRISEIANNEEFRDLLIQIKNQCKAILKYFSEIGI
jgi:ssDNA-binding Zn-finger/Zn-ribbon topoisomerase 1